jgi:predicted amidohydrolase YtcJ
MKYKSKINLKTIYSIVLFSVSIGWIQNSQGVILFNAKAMEEVLEMWPDFVEQVDNQPRGIETPGDRSILVPTPLRAHFEQLMREQPSPVQYGEGFKVLAKNYYLTSGMTTFGSRLNTNQQVTAYNLLLRNEGRLPIRFAYSFDLARQAIPRQASMGMYENIGSMWQTIEANPWLWLHGMSSEGDWDSPTQPCLKDDLPAAPGADYQKVKIILENCPDFESPTVIALMRGLRSGWRWAGIHAIGSHGLTLFVQKLEEQMERNPKLLTLDFVRNARHGFAHGNMVGTQPDVIENLKKYNLFVPLNVRRSLDISPELIMQRYGEAGMKFLVPVRSLIEQGVNVVGEAEIYEPSPGTYFSILDTYVNREIAEDGWPPNEPGETGTVYVIEEGIDRVTALKLITQQSSKFLLADTKVGTIEVGKYADFMVIDKDYLSGADREIRNNKVIMTVLGGEKAYQDSDFNVNWQ